MMINFPAHIGFKSLGQNGGRMGGVHGGVVLKLVFADVMQQFLQPWNVGHRPAAEGIEGVFLIIMSQYVTIYEC